MIRHHDDAGYEEVVPGIRQKVLVHGERTLTCEFLLTAGADLPLHAHPHEQTGYLARGRIRLFVDGEAHECGPGDSWCIAGGVEHSAEVLEDSVAIETFSPVREDLLES